MVSKSVLHRGVASTFAAEALACLQAVQIGVDIGLLVVIIEGDALSIIKKCQLDILDKLEVGVYIRDIQQTKNQFQSIRFKHIHRTAN